MRAKNEYLWGQWSDDVILVIYPDTHANCTHNGKSVANIRIFYIMIILGNILNFPILHCLFSQN